MIPRGAGAGYTIVEVMIFLAVTAILFVAAMNTIAGRQASVQFSQSTRDMQSKIQDVINSVSTGFYPGGSNFKCSIATPTDPNVGPSFSTATSVAQGASDDCIFMGKVMQLAVHDSGNTGTLYNSISVAGRKLKTDGTEVTSLAEADPTAIWLSTGPQVVESGELQFGLRVTKVVDAHDGTVYGAIAFFSSLPRYYASASATTSGAQRVSFGGVPNSASNLTLSATVDKINAISDAAATPPRPSTKNFITMNPTDGILVCLADSNSHKAMITIGGASGQATARLDIGSYDATRCG